MVDEAGGREQRVSFGGDAVESLNMRRHSFGTGVFVPERLNAEITRRYEISSQEIGAGGFGKVFVARDRQFGNRKVAIKKVVVMDHDHEKKREAFQKEIRIMKDLDHPNICKLLETYEQGRFIFFVMEYCEGKEVFDRIIDNGMIPESTAADIIRQSASALKYAHSRSIAHRDIKPENICFCDSDVNSTAIKVIDWGLGFYFGQGRMTSAVGSLTYAAPEVLEAREGTFYNSACDLWSLGVVTYVMLCGKPPFWGNYNEQLKRMKRETYPMTDGTWKGTSAEAKDFIKRLLKADPRRRLGMDAIMTHPWLEGVAEDQVSDEMASQVLCNMRKFSNTNAFFSMCVASVARQLDHRSLRDVHKVFSELDTNGDGVLDVAEIRAGFERIFGEGSQELEDVEEMFRNLDLDGSGTIDYTEFCAAGIGEHLSTKEDVLWAAFKAFDIHDDDGRISKEEIKQVLSDSDVNQMWSAEVCNEVCDEVFREFDKDGDGTIDFEEWMRLMRSSAAKQRTTRIGTPAASVPLAEKPLVKKLAEVESEAMVRGNPSVRDTYDLLSRLDRKQSRTGIVRGLTNQGTGVKTPVCAPCRQM